MLWRALLEGSEAEHALACVDDIAAEIDRRGTDDPSLAGGWAGIALMHGYRALAGRGDGADRAFAALERALAAIEAARGPWLFDGIAGIGFAVQQLAAIVGEHEDVLAELDAVVASALATNAPARFDLTHGWIGLGIYARERGLAALQSAAAKRVIGCARAEADGMAWRQDGGVNLGLAHGQAGVIAFVADAGCNGSDGLVADAIRWLLAQERAEIVPRMPMWIEAPAYVTAGTVDGWCYGAASGLVLARAGAARSRVAWREAGHRLVLDSARRAAGAVPDVRDDTSLCHGTIGRAHVFARASNALEDDEVRDVARRWYRRALGEDVLGATPDVGLQLGLAGVALGLLAASCDEDPAWDRALLLS